MMLAGLRIPCRGHDTGRAALRGQGTEFPEAL